MEFQRIQETTELKLKRLTTPARFVTILSLGGHYGTKWLAESLNILNLDLATFHERRNNNDWILSQDFVFMEHNISRLKQFFGNYIVQINKLLLEKDARNTFGMNSGTKISKRNLFAIARRG